MQIANTNAVVVQAIVLCTFAENVVGDQALSPILIPGTFKPTATIRKE